MMLWKNKILIRAEPPSSSFSCFHLPLRQHPSSPLELHSVCWKLSRKWRLACFFDSSDVYVAYQKSQYLSAVHVVKELSECLPVSDVVADDKLISGSLIAKAVDCSLRSVLLENGWRCIGNGCMVNSCFGSGDEKNDLYAIQLAVQADADYGFVFVVSPDVVRFNRLKVMDLLCSRTQQKFRGDGGVLLDECCFTTLCSVLPSLCEGHVKSKEAFSLFIVAFINCYGSALEIFSLLKETLPLPVLMIGLSILVPVEEDFKHMKDVWSFKHGLIAPNDYFVQIQFIEAAHETNQWFPSAFVLRGPGLIPAPHTIRRSKVVIALESFMKIIEGWDFFGGGYLSIKGACWLGIGSDLPIWTKAGYYSDNHIWTVNEGAAIPTTEDGKRSFFKGLLSSQDFRTPKPIPQTSPRFVSVNESSKDIFMLSKAGSLRKDIQSDTHVQFRDAVSSNMVTKFIPLFKERTHSKKTILSGSITQKSCLPSDNGAQKTNLQMEKLMQSSGPSLKGNATTEKLGLVKEIEMDLNTKEDAAMEKNVESLHISSKTSVHMENPQVFLESVPPDNLHEDMGKQLKEIMSTAVTKDTEKSTRKKQKIQRPETPNNAIVEGLQQTSLKKQAKQLSGSFATGGDKDEKLQKKPKQQQVNPSNIVAKVMEFHAKGKLGSLTVPELKSFLTIKKVKVGGKKEDLIRRIVLILA